jgi:ferric-dicitrate binding protein FerR (iron transport regulator)
MENEKKIFSKISAYYSGEGNKHEIKKKIENDPASQEIFRWVNLFWDRLTPKSSHTEQIQQLTNEKINAQGKLKSSFMLRTIKYAAVILLVLSISGIAYYYSMEESRFVEAHSGIGEVKVIELPDGSKVWLNAKSAIKYPEKFKESREVVMNGEVFFEVQKDEEHPFIVHTDHVKVEVLGTSFMVSSYSDEPAVDTYLEEGSIKLELKSLDKKMILKPGDEISFEKGTAAITKQNNPHSVLNSWRYGKISFYNESLYEIARKLERKFGNRIQIPNEHVGEMKLTADFESENLEQILTFFGEIAGIKYTANDNGFLITKK